MKSLYGIGVLASLLFLLGTPSVAAVEKLSGDNVAALLKDKAWEMTFSEAATVWDWKNGGVVCARLIGNADRESKCADEGTWRLEGDKLCWKLTWLSRGRPLNKQCVFVYRAASERFEARRVEKDGSPAAQAYFEFTVTD